MQMMNVCSIVAGLFRNVKYPRQESNLQRMDLKSTASTDWATEAEVGGTGFEPV